MRTACKAGLFPSILESIPKYETTLLIQNIVYGTNRPMIQNIPKVYWFWLGQPSQIYEKKTIRPQQF